MLHFTTLAQDHAKHKAGCVIEKQIGLAAVSFGLNEAIGLMQSISLR